MLALFRFFLAFFLGAEPSLADRLTDLQAWRNPIAQARLLAGPGRTGELDLRNGSGLRPRTSAAGRDKGHDADRGPRPPGRHRDAAGS